MMYQEYRSATSSFFITGFSGSVGFGVGRQCGVFFVIVVILSGLVVTIP
jgi:hypothetical protein